MVTDNCILQTAGGAIATPAAGTMAAAAKAARKEQAARVVSKAYADKREQAFSNARQPLILRVKLEKLVKYTHVALQQFPKRERFILCADIKDALYESIKLCIRMERRYHKKTTLQDLDAQIDFMRVLARAACALGYITPGHMKDWMEHIDEAGKIIGGLMKHFNE